MSRHGKINWKRLGKAAKETFCEVFGFLLIMGTFIIAPILLCLGFDTLWFLLCYPVGIFILETISKYKGY